jgi:hypothetical protein
MDENPRTELTEKQLRAIPYLLRATSFEEGCRRARISKRVVSVWLRDESFMDELRSQREELMTIALEVLGANASRASAVLVGLLESSKDHVRLKAAETIVRLAGRSTSKDNGRKRPRANGSEDDFDLAEFLTPEQMEEVDKANRMRTATELERATGK